MSVEEIVDALKGGPRTCPHCHEEMRSILIKDTTQPAGLYYDGSGYSYQGAMTIRTYICPHCEKAVTNIANQVYDEIHKRRVDNYNNQIPEENDVKEDANPKTIWEKVTRILKTP